MAWNHPRVSNRKNLAKCKLLSSIQIRNLARDFLLGGIYGW